MATKTVKKDSLTNDEKNAIKVLNFIATHDGIISSEDEIKYLLRQGIEKFISTKRQHLVSITKTAYPIRITYSNPNNNSRNPYKIIHGLNITEKKKNKQ